MILPRNINNLPIDIRKNFEFSSSSVQPISGISIVIPVRGVERQSNLNYSISRLLLQNVEPMEIIVSEEDSFQKINIDRFKNDSRVKKVFVKSPSKPFNKSIAINAGVMFSNYSKIVMNDADIIPPKGYLQRIDTLLNSYDCCFLGKEIYNVELIRNVVIWRGSKRVDYFSGGSIAFTKKCFIAIGGMCERFYGYGSEDCEFWERVNKLSNLYENRDSVFLHLNHKRLTSFSVNADLYNEIVSLSMDQRLVFLKEDLNKRI
jgi:predicted glycosyltransferase involved in capsule biosynthesis